MGIPVIKIKKEHKKVMLRRWDLRRAYKSWSDCKIISSCPLCVEHHFHSSCKPCPFYKLRNEDSPGCLHFIRMLDLPSYIKLGNYNICWPITADKAARIAIRKFKRKAVKYIKWI